MESGAARGAIAPPVRVLATLARSGLVDPATACDGGVTVRDSSRSNPLQVIHVKDAPGLVVKQASGMPDAIAAETEIYRWLAEQDGIDGMAPVRLSSPAEENWLVLEAPVQAKTVFDLFGEADGEALDAIVAELGRMLATLHRESAATPRRRALRPAPRPWVLDLPGADLPDFAAAHPACRAVVEQLRGRAELLSLIGEVDDRLTGRALLHGDLKLDNVLARPQPGGGWRAWLIDWELGGLGDPAWDLAGAVEGLLTVAAMRGGTAALAPAGRLGRTLIAAYDQAIGSGPATPATLLVGALAAQTARAAIQVAAMQQDGHPPAAAGVLCDLATRMATDPDAWHEVLYGE